MRYLHDVNDTPIFAEVARRAIADISGDEITATYMKKTDIEYDYNSKGEIVGINSSAIAAGAGGVEISGTDGIYVQNEIGRKIIGISADIATQSDLSGKQDAFSQETLDDIYSIPLKLDSTAFSTVSGSFATSADIQEAIENLGPLHIVGEATCDEINTMTGMKAGDVYSITDSGTIDGKSIVSGDEVAYTTSDEWIIIGRDVVLDLTAYYRKDETSGADELTSAFEEKQDLLEFSYNQDSQITAINASAIAASDISFTSGISKTVDNRLYIPLGTDLAYLYDNNEPIGIQINTNGLAPGSYSFVEGIGTLAQGDASHAAGSATTALGDASYAGGASSIAGGNYSFVHGESNSAAGRNAIVFGRLSYATDGSFAAGNEVSAVESGSFAFGNHTQAGSGVFAIGKGNETTGDVLFVVGNGDPNGLVPSYSDAFVIDYSGNAYAAGDVIAYSNGGSAISLAALDADYTSFAEEVASFSGELIDEVNSAMMIASNVEATVEGNSATWDEVTGKADTSAFNSAVSSINESISSIDTQISGLSAEVSAKVDKVAGKGLSEEDFTSAYKDKLDSIASGAEVNVQADWSETAVASDSYIANKPDIIIPLSSTQAEGGFAAAKYLKVVSAMPTGSNIDPDMIYLVAGTLIGS